MSEPNPLRAEVTELASENRPATTTPPPAPPAPVVPTDWLHVHRKLERMLVSLEQTGAIPSHEVHHIRATP